MSTRLSKRRPGFTLVELLLVLVIFAGLMAATIPLFTTQVRAFSAGSDRAALTLAGEFAGSTLTRQLRALGTNTAGRQPSIVYADSMVIAFHADLVSRISDPGAVYIDPSASVTTVQTLRRQDRYVLPGTAFTYPDSTYWQAAGVLSPAELIIFYFERDTTTTRTDDFALMRRVNAEPAEVVMRNILRSPALPFFEYHKLVPDTTQQLEPVPANQLPLRHTVPLHLAPADTGLASRIDSVRAVRVTFTSTNGRIGAAERRLSHSERVWLRNMGQARQRTCGSTPIFSTAPVAVDDLVNGAPAVRVAWAASLDEGAGEQDVIRYILWRTPPAAALGDPLLSMPSAASGTYEYVDTDVQPGESWVYWVAAQDCTPSTSAPLASSAVTVPVP